MGLGIAFKGQNVTYMVSLAFAIAASANFPALILAMFWRRTTTAGAVASILTGSVATVGLICLSPTVQVDILHHATAWFPLRNPAVLTLPLGFGAGILASLLRPDPAAAGRFEDLEMKASVGEQ